MNCHKSIRVDLDPIWQVFLWQTKERNRGGWPSTSQEEGSQIDLSLTAFRRCQLPTPPEWASSKLSHSSLGQYTRNGKVIQIPFCITEVVWKITLKFSSSCFFLGGGNFSKTSCLNSQWWMSFKRSHDGSDNRDLSATLVVQQFCFWQVATVTSRYSLLTGSSGMEHHPHPFILTFF